MGRPRLAQTRDTRSEILGLAQEFVQMRGYHGFSYQDISQRLKIKKASIHYHFPNKEDVAVALLESYCERFEKWTDDLGASKASSASLLETYFAFFARISENHSRICPCGAFAAEWHALPKRVQAASLRLIELHRAWLKKVLKAGRSCGEFRALGTPEEQANLIFSSIQGALQISRSEKNAECFRSITKQVMSSILAGK